MIIKNTTAFPRQQKLKACTFSKIYLMQNLCFKLLIYRLYRTTLHRENIKFLFVKYTVLYQGEKLYTRGKYCIGYFCTGWIYVQYIRLHSRVEWYLKEKWETQQVVPKCYRTTMQKNSIWNVDFQFSISNFLFCGF